MKPTVLVLFGITGDLARHKILPAIYQLRRQNKLSDDLRVVGISRQDTDADAVIERLAVTLHDQHVAIDATTLARLRDNLSMVRMDPQRPDDYRQLQTVLSTLPDSPVFAYLSLPPQVFSQVIANLASHGLQQAQLLIEKPFGYDESSAKALIAHTASYFPESQLYRIDHYLAKEMTRQMLTYRRDNASLNAIWNGSHIRQIEVSSSESIGIVGRANFYDSIGALRDVIQSHLLQLLAVAMMDMPADSSADSIHAARQQVLKQLGWAGTARRGQYEGYRTEVVNQRSTTETYAELSLQSQDSQWQGTTIIVRTGKSLARKNTSITITFAAGSSLTFNIQPNQGIEAHLNASELGLPASLETAINFPSSLAAYERVLLDAFNGDHTSFATDREVLESWRIVQPVLDAWQANADDLLQYQIGAEVV